MFSFMRAADNVELPAFVAERRAAATADRQPCSDRSISPVRRAHSPHQQTRHSGVPGQTNGRTRDLDEHTVRQRQYQDE